MTPGGENVGDDFRRRRGHDHLCPVRERTEARATDDGRAAVGSIAPDLGFPGVDRHADAQRFHAGPGFGEEIELRRQGGRERVARTGKRRDGRIALALLERPHAAVLCHGGGDDRGLRVIAAPATALDSRQSRVDDSTSVRRNVTTPVGSV